MHTYPWLDFHLLYCFRVNTPMVKRNCSGKYLCSRLRQPTHTHTNTIHGMFIKVNITSTVSIAIAFTQKFQLYYFTYVRVCTLVPNNVFNDFVATNMAKKNSWKKVVCIHNFATNSYLSNCACVCVCVFVCVIAKMSQLENGTWEDDREKIPRRKIVFELWNDDGIEVSVLETMFMHKFDRCQSILLLATSEY